MNSVMNITWPYVLARTYVLARGANFSTRVRGVTKGHDIRPSTSVWVCLKPPAQRMRGFASWKRGGAGEVLAPVRGGKQNWGPAASQFCCPLGIGASLPVPARLGLHFNPITSHNRILLILCINLVPFNPRNSVQLVFWCRSNIGVFS